MKQIQTTIVKKVKSFSEEQDVWRLHDYLSKKRKEIDEKYDYRYSVLIFVFVRLMREGFIVEEDLEGLSVNKLESIKRLLDF